MIRWSLGALVCVMQRREEGKYKWNLESHWNVSLAMAYWLLPSDSAGTSYRCISVTTVSLLHCWIELAQRKGSPFIIRILMKSILFPPRSIASPLQLSAQANIRDQFCPMESSPPKPPSNLCIKSFAAGAHSLSSRKGRLDNVTHIFTFSKLVIAALNFSWALQ